MSSCPRTRLGLLACQLALLPLYLACLTAEAAPDRALDIMREVEKRARTDSQSYEGAVEVINSKGKVVRRSWHFWREGEVGKSKMLIRYDAPADVRGVALLSLSAPNAPAAQWLYTPANHRLRRVAPQENSQRFMGTDLNQEDIEGHSAEEYEYQIVGEQDLAGQPVYKIKAVSKERDRTQYSHTILYVRKDILATAFVEFYVAGRLRKTMLRDDWRQFQGTWTPLLIEVKDLARGSMTRIRASNVQYHLRLDPQWFTPSNLGKIP